MCDAIENKGSNAPVCINLKNEHHVYNEKKFLIPTVRFFSREDQDIEK